ncbi:MAG: hypothetical protein AB7L91_14990, partial [Dehalococcoidia bacterium]
MIMSASGVVGLDTGPGDWAHPDDEGWVARRGADGRATEHLCGRWRMPGGGGAYRRRCVRA